MATDTDTFTLISEPRTSKYSRDYLYAYIDEATPDGRACGVSIPRGIKAAKGDTFPRSRMSFDETLRTSVLLGADELEATNDSEIDTESPARWDVPDRTDSVTVNPRPGAYGMRGPAYRKAQAAVAATATQDMPADFTELLDLSAKGYLRMAKRIGVQEPPRGEIAKSLVITVLIQYLKAHGITPPSEDDELPA